MRPASRALLVLVTATLVGAPGAHADPSPPHAAMCVAALKARAEPLVARVRQRDRAAEAQLLPIVTSTFAFIGTVYKQGLRQPQADELLRKAEQAQASVPPAELARTQDACHAEGLKLLEDANWFERQFVLRAAKARIERLHPSS